MWQQRKPRARKNRRVPDAIFDDPRLAQIYDSVDPDRSDLDVYVDVAIELGARSVLDVGCGTGTFACMLARRGVHVTAVDPARASLDVAHGKPDAAAVDWLFGEATTLPELGVLVFETRDPDRRAWEHWTPELTRTVVDVPGVGLVESWEEVTAVEGPLVTFRTMTAFRRDDVALESMSTLRFRDRSEIEESVVREGYGLTDIRDAPDRPGCEFVFPSRRAR
jgi:SAM-dependent methyltransferase